MKTDVLIAGGGIVGLATAWRLLQRFPGRKVAVLEKEPGVARHQTGHNSGVIHSGIYYRPGSYKAKLCVEGARLMTQFCAEHGIQVQRVGKLIVAVTPEERPRLSTLYERASPTASPACR